MVTIERILETCQKVGSIKARNWRPGPASPSSADFRPPLALFLALTAAPPRSCQPTAWPRPRSSALSGPIRRMDPGP